MSSLGVLYLLVPVLVSSTTNVRTFPKPRRLGAGGIMDASSTATVRSKSAAIPQPIGIMHQ